MRTVLCGCPYARKAVGGIDVLRVDLCDARQGMMLALPVRHPRDLNNILLKVGYPLNKKTISRLEELGVSNVWIRYPSLEILAKFFNEEIINSQIRVVNQITDAFANLQTQVNAKVPYNDYRKSIRTLIHQLVRNPRAAMFLGDVAETKRNGLISHSSAVTYLSLLMGLKLEGYLVRQRRRIHPVHAKEVTAMGLGAMMHDVGIIQLPDDVYQKHLETEDESDPAWQEHPSIGYDMVRGHIEPSAATVVLHHHQRFDGSGYAGHGKPVVEGERIHIFARIVAVADQFDQMRNPPNLPPQPTVGVLKALLSDEMARKFDPQVLRALLAVVPPYPPGSMVRLSDGRSGICIDHIPLDPCRPVVQVITEDERLNPNAALPGEAVHLFEQNEDLHVTHCDGYDVSELNFPRPALMKKNTDGLIIKQKGRIGLL